MSFADDLERWAAKAIALQQRTPVAGTIERLLRGADTKTLEPDPGQGYPPELREARPPDYRLVSADNALFSGIAFAASYTGRNCGNPPEFYLLTYCPCDTRTTGTLPEEIPTTGQRPGLYTGRMRTIVQRMLGAGIAPPWSFAWSSSAWIYTSTLGPEYVIEVNSTGITAAPLTYNDSLEHDCDAEVEVVPTGRGAQTAIASATDVEPYFDTSALYSECGWAANSSGGLADNLSQYTHADGYRHHAHWRIEITETAGAPSSATLTKVSDSLAWSAFASGPIYPTGANGSFMDDLNYQQTEPPGHPQSFPVHLFYDGDDLQIFTRTETTATGSTPINESPSGDLTSCPAGLNIPNDPAQYGTYRNGAQSTTPTLKYSHASIPGIPENSSFTGTEVTYNSATIESGNIMATHWFEGRADDLWTESRTTTGPAFITSAGAGFAVPNGERQAAMAMTWEGTTRSAHLMNVYQCVPRVIGEQFESSGITPKQCPDAPPDAPDCACSQSPDTCLGWIKGDSVADTGLYGPQAQHMLTDSGISCGSTGKNFYCRTSEITTPDRTFSGTVPASQSDSARVTFIASGEVSQTAWSGTVAESSYEWLTTPQDHSGDPLYMTRNAEGDGYMIPRFGGTFTDDGVQLGSLPTEYATAIETGGALGIWVGKP